MRQDFLWYLVLGADLDWNSINILAEVLALLTILLLLFIVIGGDFVDILLAIYLLDASKRIHMHI